MLEQQSDIALEAMEFGPLRVDFPVLLAPMAGYTDMAFRSVCEEFGCGASYTEVVNAAGLTHGSKRSWHMLETGPDEHPVGAHIYGADPDMMAEAARQIEETGRFDFIDINCGCPVRKIVAKGCGAALMRTPVMIERIVRALTQAVSMPVTVKTRIGMSPELFNVSDLAAAAEEGGAAAIAIHGRFASNHHRGPVDWDAILKVQEERAIPVIGNGGLLCAADAVARLKGSAIAGIMIGRGAVGRPWIFDDIRRLLRGQEPRERPLEEKRDVIELHLHRLVELKEKERRYRRRGALAADAGAALHFRSHLFQYLNGFQNWADIRRGMNEMNSTEQIMQAVDTVLSRQ